MFWIINLLVGAGNLAVVTDKALDCARRFKKEGYKIKKSDKSIVELFIGVLPFIALSLIPILNVVLLIALIKGLPENEEIYEKFKQKMIAEGSIYKEEEDTGLTHEVEKVIEKEDALDEEEIKIRTNKDAVSYWMSKQNLDVPTLTFDETTYEVEEEKGYQKTLKR